MDPYKNDPYECMISDKRFIDIKVSPDEIKEFSSTKDVVIKENLQKYLDHLDPHDLHDLRFSIRQQVKGIELEIQGERNRVLNCIALDIPNIDRTNLYRALIKHKKILKIIEILTPKREYSF